MKRTPLKRKTPLRAKNKRKLSSIAKRTKTSPRGNFDAIKGISKPDSATKKRKKKSPLKKLKETLWKLCREIQIKRHGRTCYTCGAKNLQGSNCHLGHFIPSSVCSTELRYDLFNLRPQCYHCNINLSGNWIEYEKHLTKDGIDTAQLKDRNEKTKGLQYREDWYEACIAKYQSML